MKLLLSIFIWSLTIGFVKGAGRIDSLEQVLKTNIHDSVRAGIQVILAQEYKGNKGRIAIDHCLSSIRLYSKLGMKKNANDVKYTLGLAYFYLDRIDSAILSMEEFLKIAEITGQQNDIAKAASALGTIYKNAGDYDAALKYLFKALKIKEEAGDSISTGRTLTGIANLYSNMGDHMRALTFYKRANLYKRNAKRKDDIANAFNDLGVGYLRLGHHDNDNPLYFDSARIYLQFALDLRKKENDNEGVVSALVNISGIHYYLKDFASSRKCLEEALEYARHGNNKKGEADCLMNLGSICTDLKDYKSAIQHHTLAMKFYLSAGAGERLKECYFNLADDHYRAGNFKEAYDYYKLFNNKKDSMLNEANKKNLEELNTIYQTEKKEKELLQKKSELTILEAETEKKDTQRNFLIVGLLAALLLSGLILKGFRDKQKANRLITGAYKEIELKNKIVEEKNKEITDSILYAERIQKTLLAQESLIRKNVPEHFILFKPKDIVSGDFYWAFGAERFYMAVCDSTGHGVPGAFMSLLNISFLKEAVSQERILAPEKIFDYVRERLIENISQEGVKDGMDGILIAIDKERNKMSYSAAYNAPILIRQNKIIELETDKMPVGISDTIRPFTSHIMDLKPGDRIYLFTDGYADQFGGLKGKKFKYRQLLEKLLEVSGKEMNQQSIELEETFNHWKGNLEQIDDVLIVGLKI